MTEAPLDASAPEQRLEALGIALPPAPTPLGAYVPLVTIQNMVLLSGMVPIANGTPQFRGTIGGSLNAGEGAAAARLAALNALSVLRQAFGSLDRVRRILRLTAHIRASADFEAHPQIADAASTLFNQVFGSGHTRLVVGTSTLPAGMCVELEVLAELA